MLSHRLQVLIDDELHDRLRRESARSGAPVGAVVRRELNRAFAAPDAERRRVAGEGLLALADAPGDGLEPDWADQKREMLDRPPGA
jgi:hypothetical protein